MPGCTACPAGSASPTCSPARCLRRWRAPRPRPVRRSARPASPRCASAAIRGGFAAGIIAAGGTLGILLPPSITMILFAVAAEKSLGRLFLAGIGPGLLLVTLFGIYAVFRFRKEYAAAQALYEADGTESAILQRDEFTMAERFTMLPRVLPVRAAADRRDDRALWRLRHAVGDRGPRRPAGAGADRGDLQRMAAERSVADPEIAPSANPPC